MGSWPEGVGDVVSVEALLGGVAQVIFHGVQVVEVGVQVRVHQDSRLEEDGEGQVEVEREVGEDQGERHMCDMRMTCDERLNELEPMWCDTLSSITNMTPVHCFCCAQCNNVTLGRRPPIQPSAVGDRSLMWSYHITGTPGCSTPKVDNQHSLG